ncbi:MAG: hypothetical protein AAB011_09730 [Candidatus Eisenbacteria bacterium]
MRTTVTLPDELVLDLKRRAVEAGRPFRAVLEETIARGMEAAPRRRRFRLRTAKHGGAMPGVDLTRALELAARLEDAEAVREVEQRK